MSEAKPLTAEDLAALARLEAKATKGPWRLGTKNVWNDDLLLRVADTERGRMNAGAYKLRGSDSEQLEQADAELIAAMRNALPSLIQQAQEAARLKELLRECRVAIEPITASECRELGVSLDLAERIDAELRER